MDGNTRAPSRAKALCCEVDAPLLSRTASLCCYICTILCEMTTLVHQVAQARSHCITLSIYLHRPQRWHLFCNYQCEEKRLLSDFLE